MEPPTLAGAPAAPAAPVLPVSPGAPAPPRPPSRFLLGLAGAFFLAGLALTLYAILHRPDYELLVGLDKAEQRWLQPRLARFADHHHARIALVPWSDRAELARLLARERSARAGGHARVLVADVPFDRVASLVDSSALLPLARVPGLGSASDLLASFEPVALAPGKIGGRQYLLPSRLTTLCLYYSKSHVRDAHERWQNVRPQIERWLAEVNGQGLPQNYVFEDDPEQWDSYDVFVAAAYWAAQDERGMKVARLAHAVAPEGALALDLASRAYAMGGSGGELLAASGDRLGDALAWESLLFRHGLYHPAMVKERWTASDILGAVAQGQVWMALLEPRDLFRLRGLPGQDGYVKDPADLGVAAFPRGQSLLLLHRFPARWGNPWAARTGYGWAVPASCPDPKLAAQLLRELTDDETTADAALALGWLPPRVDTAGQLDVLYRDPAEFDIARVALHELFDYARPLPGSPRWAEAAPALARLWERAAVRDQLTDPRALTVAMREALPTPVVPPSPPRAAPGSPAPLPAAR